MLLSPLYHLYGAVTRSGCLHESMDLIFFIIFSYTIQHIPEADTLNLVSVLYLLVHGVLEKGITNIWSHIPGDLQKIRNLLMQRNHGTVNPEARTCVRILCQERSWCSQLVWHLVRIHSRIVSDQGHGRKGSECLDTENEELSTGPCEAVACNNWFWIWGQWQFLQPNAPNLCQVPCRTYSEDRKCFILKSITGLLVRIPHFGDDGEKHFTILMTYEMFRRKKRINDY